VNANGIAGAIVIKRFQVTRNADGVTGATAFSGARLLAFAFPEFLISASPMLPRFTL
jgi:hypothetical protein